MRIGTITNWAYGVTLLLTGLSGTAFILSADAAADERAAVEQRLDLDTLGEELALHSEVRSDEARLYVMRGDARHLVVFHNEEAALRQRERAIHRLKSLDVTPDERAALEQAERNVDELDRIETAAIKAVQGGDERLARQLLFGPGHERAQTAVLEPIRRFRELVDARTDTALHVAKRQSDFFASIAKAMLAVTALVFLGVLYFVLRRRVVMPLTRMSRIVARLARQDYAVEVPPDPRRDEIGEMNTAIRVFRDNGLERDRLDADRRADLQTKDAILQMMHRLQACETQAELTAVVVRFAPKIFPALAGRLYVLNDARTSLSLAGSWLELAGSAASFLPSACWALRRGRPHVSNHDEGDIPCPHISEPDLASLCVPLTAQGDTIGLLHFEPSAEPERPEATRLYLELVAENIGLALANLQLRERLTSMAVKDALTGLLNRRCLDETVNRHAHTGTAPLACLMVDIDHFKRFNDMFGHDAGDAVMQHVAKIMRDIVGDRGSVYRFGGEEFTVLLPNMDEAAAVDCAERLRREIGVAPLAYRGRILGHVSVSVGIGISPVDCAVVHLVSCADAALLTAKAGGRDRVIRASAIAAPQADFAVAS